MGVAVGIKDSCQVVAYRISILQKLFISSLLGFIYVDYKPELA